MGEELFVRKKVMGRKCRPFSIAFSNASLWKEGRVEEAEQAMAELQERGLEHKAHGPVATLGDRVQQQILRLIDGMKEKEAVEFLDKINQAEKLPEGKFKAFRGEFLVAVHPSEVLEALEKAFQ